MIGFKIFISLLACVLLTSAFESEVERDNYIVGGRNAQPGQFPWIVSLRRQTRHFCGGFILSNRWIGTAAHCTQGSYNDPNVIVAITEAHSRTDGRGWRIIRIINHPRYNARYRHNDVSVLQSAAMIALHSRALPVTFPTGPAVHDGTTVLFAGWGYTEHPRRPGQGIPAVLQWKQTRTIPLNQCRQRHGVRGRLIHAESLCTLNRDGKGACTLDSGGPLILPGEGRRGTVIGLLSWGMPCGRGTPDVYTKIWAAIPFFRAASQNSIPNLPQGPQ